MFTHYFTASTIQVSKLKKPFTLWLTKSRNTKSAHHPLNDSGLGEKTEAEVHLTMDGLD